MRTLLLLLNSEIEIYVCSDNRWSLSREEMNIVRHLPCPGGKHEKPEQSRFSCLKPDGHDCHWIVLIPCHKVDSGRKGWRLSATQEPNSLKERSSLARSWTFFLMSWNRVNTLSGLPRDAMGKEHLCNSGLKHPRKLQDAVPFVAWLMTYVWQLAHGSSDGHNIK